MTTRDNETKQKTIFAETDIASLCDAIKNNDQILKAVGQFFEELDLNQKANGNGLLCDFRKWGIKTIASQVMEKQFSLIKQVKDIYEDEQSRLSD